MSDKRNRLIAGRIRNAQKSSERVSAKNALLQAVALYDESEIDNDYISERQDFSLPIKPGRALKR